MKARKILSAALALAMLGAAGMPTTKLNNGYSAITAEAAETGLEATDFDVQFFYIKTDGSVVTRGSADLPDGNSYEAKYDFNSRGLLPEGVAEVGVDVKLPTAVDKKIAECYLCAEFMCIPKGTNEKLSVSTPHEKKTFKADDNSYTCKISTSDLEDKQFECAGYFQVWSFEDLSPKDSLSDATVKAANKTYTGKALKPAPTVKLNDRILKKSTDYTVSYKNNVKCGKATVTVTGKGDYTGTKSGSFIIKPKKVTAKKLTSPKTRTVKLTWTKAAGGVTGYEVQIAANSKFTKGKKSVTVAKASATSKTVTKLKKDTTYYARVRAYKTVGKTKYYGAYSAVKSVKCK